MPDCCLDKQSSTVELFTEGQMSTFCYRSLKSGKSINLSNWAYPTNLILIPWTRLRDDGVGRGVTCGLHGGCSWSCNPVLELFLPFTFLGVSQRTKTIQPASGEVTTVVCVLRRPICNRHAQWLPTVDLRITDLTSLTAVRQHTSY